MHSRNVPPYPVEAIVMSQAPPDGIFVFVPVFGAGSAIRARILSDAHDDAWRTSQKPLPVSGTHGVVWFINGDSRNCIWMGALSPNLQSARTMNGSTGAGTTYRSEISGYYELRDENGDQTFFYPDGSSISMTEAGAIQTPNRQVVENQNPVRQNITGSQLIDTPKSSKTFLISIFGGLAWKLQGMLATLTGNLQVNGNITATGTITGQTDVLAGPGSISGKGHKHTGVQTGSGESAGPTN